MLNDRDSDRDDDRHKGEHSRCNVAYVHGQGSEFHAARLAIEVDEYTRPTIDVQETTDDLVDLLRPLLDSRYPRGWSRFSDAPT